MARTPSSPIRQASGPHGWTSRVVPAGEVHSGRSVNGSYADTSIPDGPGCRNSTAAPTSSGFSGS
jgi:hypothetical protein